MNRAATASSGVSQTKFMPCSPMLIQKATKCPRCCPGPWRRGRGRHYRSLAAYAFSDAASAATTDFRIEGSRDNTNCRVLAQAGTAASTVATLSADLLYRYARVVLVNGASAQTSFELGLNALAAT